MQAINALAGAFHTSLYNLGFSDIVEASGLEVASGSTDTLVALAYIEGYAAAAESANRVIESQIAAVPDLGKHVSVEKVQNAACYASHVQGVMVVLSDLVQQDAPVQKMERECAIQRETLEALIAQLG